jgi:hypothetical protein
MKKNGLSELIDGLPKINGDATTVPIGPAGMPDIPPGAVAVGMVKKGSVIYELPPFTRYLVFHQTEPPQIITLDGRMMPLDVDNPAAVAR